MRSQSGLNLFNWRDPKIKTLHITWVAFFLSFVVWFSHAPLLVFIQEAFDLSSQQVKALLILNVALTIPARIIVGMMVDKFGPRSVYSALLMISSVICIGFATADSYVSLALFRFLLGFVGAGFVIGIRMVGEWFPAKQVGLAEGIYGGWGNFGSAAGAMTLPGIALLIGGENGWRYALGLTGVIAGLYGFLYYRVARNTPEGATYFKPKKTGGLEVTSRKDLYLYLLMNIPMYLALASLGYKLSPAGVQLLTWQTTYVLWGLLVLLFAVQSRQIWLVNREHLRAGVPELEKYEFKQVAILDLAYFVTFGSELAVVSMLPLFFLETFDGLNAVQAGLLASGFAFMNLVSRPTGGHFSDKMGRRNSLMFLVGGLAVGYLVLSQIDSDWWIPAAVIATMACSFFVQAGEGAVFAVVPLVKRRMTGQIAGMAGAYGNVGAVAYLTALSYVDYSTFFLIIAGSAALVFFICAFMDEPKGRIAERLPDGTVHLISVE
ncbi:NarK family nitrate/nitrite MFS transporter [Microbulbifer thermotolerans]|uniref:Nitrate/nitrite transporter n=1 Tax=Microbulbifer thermotolerans TaxID=252514 RepID=A0A143HK44_MICTH|nr:NarK family nitrate/nitrite MFS transporter [Microbulbifer thermotolerans]AMX01857.1 MFS transporter [Microbulbifer thermotolerans]MCX2783999.1 NarK family nitrate/nitrite MFS transporter [Microbulbifer thermotolerans]MCX2840703.1 NarK family nitrate/nitrite MFS transporter [Microbulbifer thermotolerans]WKT61382.1 NarK family nitrate/nitrite MFS transporter [Microbulbifer thermotolerans]SFC89220.1 MFS transporter, NNP family, nitrate/nitrite transporter [Microbulbifer thermotolerans]